MSDEDIRAQRAALLLQFDDQKQYVALLQVRDALDREMFQQFVSIYADRPRHWDVAGETGAEQVRFGPRAVYPLAALDVPAALERKRELNEAVKYLADLAERAKLLRITLS